MYQKHGRGIEIKGDATYVGWFSKGVKHGYGKLYFKDTVYEGNFI